MEDSTDNVDSHDTNKDEGIEYYDMTRVAAMRLNVLQKLSKSRFERAAKKFRKKTDFSEKEGTAATQLDAGSPNAKTVKSWMDVNLSKLSKLVFEDDLNRDCSSWLTHAVFESGHSSSSVLYISESQEMQNRHMPDARCDTRLVEGDMDGWAPRQDLQVEGGHQMQAVDTDGGHCHDVDETLSKKFVLALRSCKATEGQEEIDSSPMLNNLGDTKAGQTPFDTRERMKLCTDTPVTCDDIFQNNHIGNVPANRLRRAADVSKQISFNGVHSVSPRSSNPPPAYVVLPDYKNAVAVANRSLS